MITVDSVSARTSLLADALLAAVSHYAPCQAALSQHRRLIRVDDERPVQSAHLSEVEVLELDDLCQDLQVTQAEVAAVIGPVALAWIDSLPEVARASMAEDLGPFKSKAAVAVLRELFEQAGIAEEWV